MGMLTWDLEISGAGFGVRSQPSRLLSDPVASFSKQRLIRQLPNRCNTLEEKRLKAKRPAAEVSAPGVNLLGGKLRYFAGSSP
jgi:hypothetical protein